MGISCQWNGHWAATNNLSGHGLVQPIKQLSSAAGRCAGKNCALIRQLANFTDRRLRDVQRIACCYINIYCKLARASSLTDRLLLLSTVLRDDGTVVVAVRSDESLRRSGSGSDSSAPPLSRFTASPPLTRWRAVSVMWLHFRRSSLSSADVGEHRSRSRWHRCSVDVVPAHIADHSRFNAIKRLTVT